MLLQKGFSLQGTHKEQVEASLFTLTAAADITDRDQLCASSVGFKNPVKEERLPGGHNGFENSLQPLNLSPNATVPWSSF